MTPIKKIKEPKIIAIKEEQSWLEFVISMNNDLTGKEKKEMLNAEGSLTQTQIKRLVQSVCS